jgi:hypothetical protein
MLGSLIKVKMDSNLIKKLKEKNPCRTMNLSYLFSGTDQICPSLNFFTLPLRAFIPKMKSGLPKGTGLTNGSWSDEDRLKPKYSFTFWQLLNKFS